MGKRAWVVVLLAVCGVLGAVMAPAATAERERPERREEVQRLRERIEVIGHVADILREHDMPELAEPLMERAERLERELRGRQEPHRPGHEGCPMGRRVLELLERQGHRLERMQERLDGIAEGMERRFERLERLTQMQREVSEQLRELRQAYREEED